MSGKGFRRNPKGKGGGAGRGPGLRIGDRPGNKTGPGRGPSGCPPKYKSKDEKDQVYTL